MTGSRSFRVVGRRERRRGRWLAGAAALLIVACGAEPQAPEGSSPAEPEVREEGEEEHPPQHEGDLDLAMRLEEALSGVPEAITEFEAQLPDLRGARQARLQAEIEALSSLLVEIEEIGQSWSQSESPLREERAAQIEALLDEVDAGLARAAELVGPEST